jgi:hypothetical protein
VIFDGTSYEMETWDGSIQGGLYQAEGSTLRMRPMGGTEYTVGWLMRAFAGQPVLELDFGPYGTFSLDRA